MEALSSFYVLTIMCIPLQAPVRPYFPADRGERRRGGKWGLYVQLLNVACHLRNCDQKRLLLQKLIPETANERNQILKVGEAIRWSKEMWTKGKESQIQSSSLIQYRSLPSPRTWKPNLGPLELFKFVSPKCTSLLVPRIISWTKALDMLKSGSLASNDSDGR